MYEVSQTQYLPFNRNDKGSHSLASRWIGPIFILTSVLFSLFDVYIRLHGGRVLDLIGVFLVTILVSLLIFRKSVLLHNWRMSRPLKIATLMLLPGLMTGLLNGNILTAAAFLTGLILILPLSKLETKNKIYLAVQFIAAIHLFAFALQFFVYKLTGHIIDYLSWTGGLSPRIYNPVFNYFRPAGFFQEPNSYCLYSLLTMSALLTPLNRSKVSVLLASLLGASMFFSESLWGMAMALAAMFLYASTWEIRALSVAIGTLFLGLAFFYPRPLEIVFHERTIHRIQFLKDDPSASDRFFAQTMAQPGSWILKMEQSSLGRTALWTLGRGISSTQFQRLHGANGLGFFIYSFGFLGFLGFLYGAIALSGRRKFALLVVILLSLTTYPITTYCYWWLWLGVVHRLSNIQDTSQTDLPALGPEAASSIQSHEQQLS